MSGYGYPQNPPGHGYGYGGAPPPPHPYGGHPPYGTEAGSKPPKENKPYGGAGDHGHGYPSPAYGPPSGQPYGQPPKENKPYGDSDHGHGYPSAPEYGQPPYGAEGGVKPPKENKPYGSGSDHGHGYPSASSQPYGQPPYGGPHQGGGDHGHGYPSAAYGGAANPFAAVLPSTFPPGTEPSVIACFQVADQDGSGLIDDKELQRALSSYNQSFSLRTVHLLMYSFTNSNSRKIGPKEFVSVYYSLQSWREIFERFDRDRSGKIDASELRDALYNLGFSVSPVILDLLVSKFDKTGGKSRAIEYDNFIECCLTVKGLTEKFKAKDKAYTGTATFTYEDFMLAVLPFLVA